MSTIDIENSPLPSQLLEQLVRGYDALNAEFKLLNEYRRELENKLSWAKQQVAMPSVTFALSLPTFYVMISFLSSRSAAAYSGSSERIVLHTL